MTKTVTLVINKIGVWNMRSTMMKINRLKKEFDVSLSFAGKTDKGDIIEKNIIIDGNEENINKFLKKIKKHIK